MENQNHPDMPRDDQWNVDPQLTEESTGPKVTAEWIFDESEYPLAEEKPAKKGLFGKRAKKEKSQAAAPQPRYYGEPISQAPVEEAPAYTEAANEAPVYEEPGYEAPVYDQAAFDEPAFDEAAFDEPAFDEAAFDEAAYAEAEEAAYYEDDQYYEDDPKLAKRQRILEKYYNPDAPDGAQPKRRPHAKRGYGLLGIPHLIATGIWLAIILGIGVSLGRIVWVCAADILAFGREEQIVQVEITASDNIDTIAEKLKQAGAIRYPQVFKFYAGLAVDEGEISTGTFTLNTLYDYHALVNAMSPYAEGREEIKVTIPEGYTCAQIFALLEEKRVCTVAELEEYAANGELGEYWFLEGVPRGDKYCLEGYLFPDTYNFYTNDTPQHALEKLLDGFDYRFTDKMIESIDAINQEYTRLMTKNGYSAEHIEANQLTIRDIVTIASMVEKETAGGSDSYMIASVIYNRLSSPDYPYLNIDATIVYALGGKSDPLTYADLQVDSPYNTYTEPGLPIGPISNPGRDSLYAALEPYAETDYYKYYYYVFDPSAGVHLYSETYEEHERKIAQLG